MRKPIIIVAVLAFALHISDAFCAPSDVPINVRVGAHDRFDRVVFDWPVSTGFRVSREGEKAFLHFDALGVINFPQKAVSKISRARGFSVKEGDKGVVVSFVVAVDAEVKAFASNKSIVVDIIGRPAPMNIKATEVVAEPAKTEALTPDGSLVTGAGEDKDKAVSAEQVEKQPLKEDIIKPSEVVSSEEEKTKVESIDQTESGKVGDVSKAEASIEEAIVRPSLNLTEEPMLVATLDPRLKTRAVIYQRAGVGYVIFDRKLSLTPEALANGSASLVDITAFDMPKNSGYRFVMPLNSDIKATMDGTSWKVFLSKKQPYVPVTTSLVAQPDFALGARFLLPLPDAPDPIRFSDPVVGDDLVLVPLAKSEAFNIDRRTPDIAVLPAAQGLVVKPLTDKVVVRPVSDGVEITAEGGLLLSKSADTGTVFQSGDKLKAKAPLRSMFDFHTWKGKPGETFTQTRRRLQQTVIDVPEADRDRARLELARFYFANGNGAEAVSLLLMLAKRISDLRSHADFMGLLGAAKIWSNRPAEGMRDMFLPALSGQPEIELWHAVGAAKLRDWQVAEEKFSARQSVMASYPEPFFSRFFVLAIESALAVGKDRVAADWLSYLSNSPHLKSVEPAISFLEGVLQAKAGRIAAAEAAWKSAAASNDRLYKVRSEISLIDLGVSTASLTPAQAAERMEAMRFGWRGDDLEADILHRLGQFYVKAGNIKSGLSAMSQAVKLYPSSSLSPSIRGEMASVFHDVFVGKLGKNISPLDNLMLYQQYQNLMPEGKEGVAIMMGLVERLVAVDLLEQAADILDNLVKNHLKGEERTRAVLRMVAVRLLDKKFPEAIAGIDMMGDAQLSAAQQNEKLLLRARALAGMDKVDEAVSLLRDNSSPGALMLKADIAMKAKRWGEAALALMDIVGPPPQSGTVLTTEQSGHIVNAALAYALDNNQSGLDRLGIDYSAAMVGTPQHDVFRMLTRPEKTGQLRDLSAAQAQISQVDMFQNFLNSYRKPETQEAVSSIQQ